MKPDGLVRGGPRPPPVSLASRAAESILGGLLGGEAPQAPPEWMLFCIEDPLDGQRAEAIKAAEHKIQMDKLRSARLILLLVQVATVMAIVLVVSATIAIVKLLNSLKAGELELGVSVSGGSATSIIIFLLMRRRLRRLAGQAPTDG